MFIMQTCARLSAILGLAILLTLPGCKKTDSINDSNPGLEAPVKTDDALKVTATITGTVLDENNKPVSGAGVSSGTYTASTDAMGNFIIKDASISKANGYVIITKSGYFKGIRSFVTEAGKNNYVKIQLIKQVVTGTVTATTGGVINTLDGASISFPANAFVTQSGAAYTGTVFVYAKWIDPTAASMPLIIPGDLRGIDSANGEYILKSYGMVGAELQDNSGNILKLAPGKTATVSFPIPAALQSAAPQTIPLWHFDETIARWKQEGSAAKSGNNYIGQVNKFSFWNVDVPGNFINLDLRLINSASNLPLANTMVKITSLSTGMTAYDFTNDSGYVAGYVPKNQNLKLEVITGTACANNNVVHTQNIGPYTSNTSLGNISVTIPANQVINFTATIVNCSNQPVTNGYISLNLAGGSSTIAYSNAAGTVSFSMIYCGGGSSYSYTGVDLSNGNYSTMATGTTIGNTVNLGTITACGNTINTSGVYIAGSIDNNAVLWKDGVPVYLTNIPGNTGYRYAYAIQSMIYNNDVYVLGEEDDSTVANGVTGTLKIWKNGALTNVTNGSTNAVGAAFDIYNGDIYVAGSESSSTQSTQIKVWKNGVASILPKDTFVYAEVYDIKVINGDVYVCGACNSNSNQVSFTRPVYWKNGQLNVLPNSGYYGSASSISYNNGDVYICGEEQTVVAQSVPLYWKNGIKTTLNMPPAYNTGYARKIFVDNSDVYVAGNTSFYTTNQGTLYNNVLYWKNNSAVFLSNYSSSNLSPDITGLFVKNNVVYTVGYVYGIFSDVLYFQNNVPVPLTGYSSGQYVYANTIFVK